MGEFELIERIFKPLGMPRADVVLGIGDDAALLRPPPGQLLVSCIDTLVAGVHFPQDMAPEDVGYRLGAVNLSDLAAMGARPAWGLLALTLPQSDVAWLEGFARGLAASLAALGVVLVGGDTTRGPLCVSLQLTGLQPDDDRLLTRGGARPGDGVYVSGTLGDAAAGLAQWGTLADSPLLQRFRRPTPRVALGAALRGLASSCIDVSDGLLADAGHLAEASGCCLRIDRVALPLSPALQASMSPRAAAEAALQGGDDYELCFTLPATARSALPDLERLAGCSITRVGEVVPGQGVVLVTPEGEVRVTGSGGYRHF